MSNPYIKIKLKNNKVYKAFLVIKGQIVEINLQELEKRVNKFNVTSIGYSRSEKAYILNDNNLIRSYLERKNEKFIYHKAPKVTRKNKYSFKVFTAAMGLVTILSTASIISSHAKTSQKENEIKPEIETLQIYEPEENKIENCLSENVKPLQQENIISIDYEFRKDSEKNRFAKQNYKNIVDKIAPMYGLDSNLVLAIITQENAYNSTECYAKGVMCIEPVWYENDINAFNYKTNSLETLKINGAMLVNPEYAIKVGCMILANEYKNICNKYPTLNESEKIVATIMAYNKGSGAISKIISQYGNNFKEHINETNNGDNLYYQHVLSYLDDGQQINFKNYDGSITSATIDNLQSNSFKK